MRSRSESRRRAPRSRRPSSVLAYCRHVAWLRRRTPRAPQPTKRDRCARWRGQGRSEPRRPRARSGCCDGRTPTTTGVFETRHGCNGSSGCSAGSIRRHALLIWALPALVLAGLLVVSSSCGSCAPGLRRSARAESSSLRATCAISTSGPRSLPADIGAAARALWDRGERRAALALLYRGLLSRLVHVHRLPIRDSRPKATALRLLKHIFRARLPAIRRDW